MWKMSATVATWKRSQRRTRASSSWHKKSATRTSWKNQRCPQSEKKTRATRKKSATRVTWGKISNVRDLGKKAAMSATWEGSQRRTRATPKSISEMRSLGKNQRRARPRKKSAMCATWKRIQRRARPVKKIQRRAQAEKEVSEGLVLAGKNSSIGTTWKKNNKNKSNMKKKCDWRDLWKRSHRQAQSEQEVSDGIVRPGKRNQRRA